MEFQNTDHNTTITEEPCLVSLKCGVVGEPSFLTPALAAGGSSGSSSSTITITKDDHHSALLDNTGNSGAADYHHTEELKQYVKSWIQCDKDLIEVQKEFYKKKNEKKKISKALMKIMNDRKIDCLDIQNGQIVYNRKEFKKPLTTKKTTEILTKYFDGDTEQVFELTNFLTDHREIVTKESIINKK